jgi:hypothetical protein
MGCERPVKYLLMVCMCCMRLCARAARLTSNQTTPLFLAVIRQIDALHNGLRQVNSVLVQKKKHVARREL